MAVQRPKAGTGQRALCSKFDVMCASICCLFDVLFLIRFLVARQVFISIQSLIMVDDPYFNEPGYESQMGTPAGREASEQYNNTVRERTLRHAMIEQLRNPPDGFRDVVQRHFALVGPAIVEQFVALDKFSSFFYFF